MEQLRQRPRDPNDVIRLDVWEEKSLLAERSNWRLKVCLLDLCRQFKVMQVHVASESCASCEAVGVELVHQFPIQREEAAGPWVQVAVMFS